MLSFRMRGLYSLPTLVAEIFGLIALGSSLVFGQGSTSAITGTVKDMSGAAVERAAITVRHIETGLTRAAEADSSGNYRSGRHQRQQLQHPIAPGGPAWITAEKMAFRSGAVLQRATATVKHLEIGAGSAAWDRLGGGSGSCRRSDVASGDYSISRLR